MGIGEFFKNLFGGKREQNFDNEPTARIEKRPEPSEVSDVGERWKTAKKWREQKAMEEPLVKRKRF
jgi:predicted acyl esterase